MSTSYVHRGDSPAVSQITKVTPANVIIGDKFNLICNGKTISYTALANSVADVVAGLVAAVGATTIPEFKEFLATDNGSYLTLVAVTPGVPFEITASSSVTSAGNVTIVETTP